MKELNILSRAEVGSSFYQPRRTIRVVASEILKMNPALRYFLSLTMKLASCNPLHKSSLNRCLGSHSKLKGTLIEFSSKIVLTAATSVTWRKVFHSSSVTTAMYKCTIITLLDDSNLKAFQTF